MGTIIIVSALAISTIPQKYVNESKRRSHDYDIDDDGEKARKRTGSILLRLRVAYTLVLSGKLRAFRRDVRISIWSPEF